DYLAKFGAYYEYRASGRFERDYQGFPTILVVTSDTAAEERIARAVRAAAVGRGPALPLLLTCEWRLADARNPYGLLGPIWREPGADVRGRRYWPLNTRAGRRDQLHMREDAYLVHLPDQQRASSTTAAAAPSRGLTEEDIPWQTHEEIGRVE
ncbi:MAG: hypothetical protein HY691_00610, partial [Chloroflexi bacterium]|nr:hypothetical protein [Chloroflexota bacterium]